MKDERRLVLMIGGAHKAGTTALLHGLASHPGLATHRASELTFFVEDAEHAQGFDSRAWRRYLPRDDGRFVGKHVKLMYRRAALERLRAHSPGVLVVLVLRHPVERAHSAFWHAVASGREELATFEAALAAEEERIRGGRAPWHDTAYVRNGLYAHALADAFEVFGRERVRVYLTADLRARGAEIVGELCAELGLAPHVPDLERGANRARAARHPRLARVLSRVFDSRAPAKRLVRAALPDRLAVALRERLVRWNSRPLAPPPLATETRAALLARFRESNARVAEMLGRDLSAWQR
jgi:hypothetical protein